MNNKYKIGDVLRGKVNGAEVEIVEVEKGHYTYIDLKSGKKFTHDCKTLDRFLLEKVN